MLKVIERRFSSRVRWSLLAPVDSSSAGGRLPRPEGVSCARNFAFGAQIRLARICQVERAAEALDQRHRPALRSARRPLGPPTIPRSRDARSPTPGRWLRACWRTGSATAPGHSAPIAETGAGRTPPPPDAAHSQSCGVRRSWGKTRASCRRTPAVVTPGFLPYALRASLRLFKFVPDEFVHAAGQKQHWTKATLDTQKQHWTPMNQNFPTGFLAFG